MKTRNTFATTTRLRGMALALAAIMVAGLWATASQPVIAQGVSEDDPLPRLSREQVEWIVRNYLLENPEIIEQAMTALEEKRRIEAAQAAQNTLKNNAELIFRDPMDPTIGNPEGTVDMVHFFDYQCGFCKNMARDLAQTLQPDGRVRAQFKEFPILGPASVVAARAAMAAERQGMYWDMHQALMNNRGRLSENRIFALAQGIGLDMQQLRRDMNDPAITQHLEKNRALANRLGIDGTPGFVIGSQIYPTSLSPENLRIAIDQAEAEREKAPSEVTTDSRG